MSNSLRWFAEMEIVRRLKLYEAFALINKEAFKEFLDEAYNEEQSDLS